MVIEADFYTRVELDEETQPFTVVRVSSSVNQVSRPLHTERTIASNAQCLVSQKILHTSGF